jgi:hypothetical protein
LKEGLNWTSPDGSVANAVYKLHALNLVGGTDIHPPLTIEAQADAQTFAGRPPAVFIPSRQEQRAALLLATPKGAAGTPGKKTLFTAFAMTHEEHDETHGWLLAYDVTAFRQTAAWTTTPGGLGAGGPGRRRSWPAVPS